MRDAQYSLLRNYMFTITFSDLTRVKTQRCFRLRQITRPTARLLRLGTWGVGGTPPLAGPALLGVGGTPPLAGPTLWGVSGTPPPAGILPLEGQGGWRAKPGPTGSRGAGARPPTPIPEPSAEDAPRAFAGRSDPENYCSQTY